MKPRQFSTLVLESVGLDRPPIYSITTRMIISDLTSADLRRAADIKEQLDQLQQELAGILGGEVPSPAAPGGRKKKRTMSAAARALIGAAQRARWAKLKRAAKSAAKPKKKKFTMSAAAKAAISRAAKARWAKIKAAQNK